MSWTKTRRHWGKIRRRNYLRRKGAAYTRLALGRLLIVFGAISTVVCVLLAVYVLVNGLSWPFGEGAQAGPAHLDVDAAPDQVALILGVIALFSMAAAGIGSALSKQAKMALRHIPYISPVSSSSLPANEVLVRGSEEPAAAQETLLRAARESGAARAEELLRPENKP